MARVLINDHTIWLKHIESERIARRLTSLKPNAPVALRIEGKPVLFRSTWCRERSGDWVRRIAASSPVAWRASCSTERI